MRFNFYIRISDMVTVIFKETTLTHAIKLKCWIIFLSTLVDLCDFYQLCICLFMSIEFLSDTHWSALLDKEMFKHSWLARLLAKFVMIISDYFHVCYFFSFSSFFCIRKFQNSITTTTTWLWIPVEMIMKRKRKVEYSNNNSLPFGIIISIGHVRVQYEYTTYVCVNTTKEKENKHFANLFCIVLMILLVVIVLSIYPLKSTFTFEFNQHR